VDTSLEQETEAEMFPRPESKNHTGKIFQSPRLWEFNVCGASVAGLGGALLLLVVGGILASRAEAVQGQLVGVILILTAVALVVGLSVGNLPSAYPYAVEMEDGKGVYLYAPFRKTYIDMKEIKEVKWSYLRTGWVVKLRKRHGLVKTITIHAAFGSQGREFAMAVQKEIGRIG
jgi:hypothetical protein